MKKFLLLVLLAAAAVSCGIYSFTGTNIQSDVKTITIPFVEYKALRVNPSLSNDLTESSASSLPWSRWMRTATWSSCAR